VKISQSGAALAGGYRRETSRREPVLGVVVDSDGTPPAFIPPGASIDIATAQIRCATGASAEVTSTIRFVDNKYASAEGGPVLENLVTVGGLSITKDEGLKLTDGSITCKLPDRRVVFKIEDGTVEDGSNCGVARVPMEPRRDELRARDHARGTTLDSIAVETPRRRTTPISARPTSIRMAGRSASS
jgi:hypothetical protein